MGKSWEQIAKYVVQFDWAVRTKNMEALGLPKERIWLTYDPKASGHQVLGSWKQDIDLVYSDDFFKTHKLALKGGNKFSLGDDFILVAKAFKDSQDEVELWVSNIISLFQVF